MNLSASQWSVTELFLRCSSRPPDEVAWQEFVRRYHTTIRTNVMKTHYGKSKRELDRKSQFFDDTVEDLVQAVYIVLIEDRNQSLKRFADKPANSIYQYLAKISKSVVHNHFRETTAQKRPKISFSLDQLLECGDGALLGNGFGIVDDTQTSGEGHLTIEDIENALRKAVIGKNRDRDITIFKLRYFEGLTLDEISKTIESDVSAVTVGSILNRIIRRLKPLLTEGLVIDRYKESDTGSNRSLKTALDDSELEYKRVATHLMSFVIELIQDEIDIAKRYWYEAVNSAVGLNKEQQWHELASTYLTTAARSGHLEFVRQLIKESDLEEPLFPLARAIDYLLTGDEALIEKLSPEVRGIVEEITIKLRPA